MAEEKTSTNSEQPANPDAKTGEPGHFPKSLSEVLQGIKPQGAAGTTGPAKSAPKPPL